MNTTGTIKVLIQASSWRRFEPQFHRQPGSGPSERWDAGGVITDSHMDEGVLDTPAAMTAEWSLGSRGDCGGGRVRRVRAQGGDRGIQRSEQNPGVAHANEWDRRITGVVARWLGRCSAHWSAGGEAEARRRGSHS